MTIPLELPPELEAKLVAEASHQGVSLSDYLIRVLSNGGQAAPSISGAELVAYGQHMPATCARRRNTASFDSIETGVNVTSDVR